MSMSQCGVCYLIGKISDFFHMLDRKYDDIRVVPCKPKGIIL
jgi:hypothetical protein